MTTSPAAPSPDASPDARSWSRMARKYAKSPITDVPGYEKTLAATRRYLKTSDAALELGCGTGTTALRLGPHVARLVASDIAEEMIAIGREKAAAAGASNVEFTVATPERAPWPDAAFDAVLAFNLLHLLPDRPAALAQIRRVVKPGGLFISKTALLAEMSPLLPPLIALMRALGQAPHVARVSAATLEREIEAAGFAIDERARHGTRGKDTRIFLVARAV